MFEFLLELLDDLTATQGGAVADLAASSTRALPDGGFHLQIFKNKDF